MKILLTCPHTDAETTDFMRAGNIVHAPGLDAAPGERLLDALLRHGATGLITSRRPDERLLGRWESHVPDVKFLAYETGSPSSSRPGGITEHRCDLAGVEALASALARCERRFTLDRPLPDPGGGGGSPRLREVVLIGAGIVNLVTAVSLVLEGHRVTVLDRSPAPGSTGWQAYGCTHAGDDARMFTFTEMDSYNNQDFHGSAPGVFRRTVEEHGWLAREFWSLSAHEHAWIEEFERVPSWLARTYNDDVFALSAEAAGEWARLRGQVPELFDGVVLADGILRLYADPDHREASLARHRAVGAVLSEPSAGRLAHDFPGLAGPLGDGTLAGGFLVPGFTLNVHKFVRRTVAWLADRGARFHWNTPVTGVRRDAFGTVTGLDCAVQAPPDAHVVVSPGVPGDALLAGTPCAGMIHGVLGGWIRVGNHATRLRHSLKVARRGHITEDANVTVAVDGDGRQILIVGSGYGYTGAGGRPDERQLRAMRHGILDTVERIFPGCDEPGPSSRSHDDYTFKYCVRPWTATSLGLYHTEPILGGGLFIITGGHNTGGFAQSPAVARAVLASLHHEPHPMHRLYHPERFSAFAPRAQASEASAALPLATHH
ncbi:FAD-dependent oxidoreductase [Streptomyces sp. NPDC021356]|uniref:NAD(P)/FAD-dependent oxidoreductase n=1 Tax=Streptomyces sp. NPDC021356 TaxID=3154900 RepID=UPI0033CAF5AD